MFGAKQQTQPTQQCDKEAECKTRAAPWLAQGQEWSDQMPTNAIEHSILRIGIPAVVILLAALFGALLVRDTTVKAEAAHIAERFVLSDDAAEDAGELRAQLIHCDISVPAPLGIALDAAFTARPSAYRRGFNEAYLRFALVDCNALERRAKNYKG